MSNRQDNKDAQHNRYNQGIDAVTRYPLIDTHTHFDDFVFDDDRLQQAQTAHQSGVQNLLLIGYLAKYFDRLIQTQQQMHEWQQQAIAVPQAHLTSGLHPAYIADHSEQDLTDLADFIKSHHHIAIGEIGLDTFTDELKTAESVEKQKRFFKAQLDLAVEHQLPVLLHIRKAHAECLALLKQHEYDAHKLGGIAHSFSGGEQEAKAFVKLGFKLGVTGQVTNPNAKKLRRGITEAVNEYGIECLVLETDCPDMTPICCQHGDKPTRNVPANLPAVLDSLSELLEVDKSKLAKQLWQNSCDALRVDWAYPE
ncbi:TatD family hydrolase [Psychrobacter sp. FDAARGOS_221]|uniref:TatD family hydrolase n=1 Tax=Psychrobacter sp. FDAARGOS_221 TaxID=1975705 RepID=UPI000BB56B68|nr:TatD family hydrolase [Psychrobacter sp. FDAARGOS_221]PNK61176.1 TatD family deoxyribonuclease [Psychrobacter sp. FDAARGOS_221]